MSLIRKLAGLVVLTSVLGVAALAGEIQSPPCSPPDPGIIHTPPCSAAQVMNDDSTAPGQTTPPAADTVDVISVVETALIELLILW